MKRGAIFIIIMILVFSLYSVNALIISEVESNPEGTDSKNEWIELYSEEPINGEYILANNDAGKIYDNEDKNQLKIKFNFQGYYVYIFDGQWLDNSDEKVYLYNIGDTLIDSTNIFDDNEDSNFTWQRCNGTWVFQEQTREKENCPVQDSEEQEEPEDEEKEVDGKNEEDEESEEESGIDDEENEDEEECDSEEDDECDDENNMIIEEVIEEPEGTQEKTDYITQGVIRLDSKDIKSKSNKEKVDKNNFATILLGIIAILLLILLFSQKRRQTKIKKNEFR